MQDLEDIEALAREFQGFVALRVHRHGDEEVYEPLVGRVCAGGPSDEGIVLQLDDQTFVMKRLDLEAQLADPYEGDDDQ